MLDFILLLLCITFISLNVFFKKVIIKHITLEEYMIGITIFVPIVIIFYFLIRFGLIRDKKLDIKLFEKINKNNNIILLLIGTAIITVSANLILVELLKRKNVSYLVPHIAGLSLILSIILAYLLFEEKIDWKMFLGIILIIIGVFVINCSKNIKK